MNIEERKDNFLAASLLDVLEDEDLRSAETILEKYKANPNKIVLGRGIAPIHYACGMENAQIGEKIVDIMLKFGGDPNIKSAEGATPLHVASIANRPTIVRWLLEHGGDIHAVDDEGKTPILYAVVECHLDVIKTFQNFVFEKKYVDSRAEKIISENKLNLNVQSPRNKNLAIRGIENSRLTPNRVHYNFDTSSPYYIYITHRKTTSSEKRVPINLNEMPSCDETPIENRENLFQLTEDNLEKFSEQLSSDKSTTSIIERWRAKIQCSKSRASIVRVFNSIDELLSGFSSDETLNFSNTSVDPNYRPPETPKTGDSDRAFAKLLDQLRNPQTRSDQSFLTANDRIVDQVNEQLSESNFIRSPHGGEYIFQVAETYRHTDEDNGLVFIETHLHANPADKNEVKSRSSLATSISVPSTYDTDELRAELTNFGEPPGPITKSTKKLYMKRLIRYKRSEVEAPAQRTDGNKPREAQFSVELERTVQQKEWFDRIQENLNLEIELKDHFQENSQKRNFREGTNKTSFIYLLIDPRVSRNLPGECKFISSHEAWNRFVASIFYVGKGKSSRPYSHLYEALKLFSANCRLVAKHNENNVDQINIPLLGAKRDLSDKKKLNNIMDIWKSNRGVVCLHVFHNLMPTEAYTREAAIIDAMGLKHLTNLKRGDYYGACQSWTMRKKKFLGIFLLYKAMLIYLAEGESQLRPTDL